VDTSTLADQSYDSTIKTVWKLVYWILALFFLGFGIFALIGGSEWWGAIFIINGILFINSSTSLNGKSKKILGREIVYLVLVLFFCFFGTLITLATECWWGISFFFIMTIFSVLSTSLKEGSKANPVIEIFYKKINSLSFVNASPLSDSQETDTETGHVTHPKKLFLLKNLNPYLKKSIQGIAGIVVTVLVAHYNENIFSLIQKSVPFFAVLAVALLLYIYKTYLQK
jgi:hypothetical protein